MSEAVENQVVEEVVVAEEVATNEVELESDKTSEPEISIDDLQAKLKQQEEYIKKMKDEKSQAGRQDAEAKKQAEIEEARNTFIRDNVQDFISNGMEATPEQLAEAEKYGITPEQIKLAAYEARDNANKVYSIVGGKEQYDAIMDFMSEHLTDAQKKAYTKDVINPDLSEFAVKGLMADYKARTGGDNVVEDNRIVAESTNVSKSSAYRSMEEYYKDMRYMRTLPKAKQASYHSKINDKLNRSKLV